MRRIWKAVRRCIAMPLFLLGVILEELAYAIGEFDD